MKSLNVVASIMLFIFVLVGTMAAVGHAGPTDTVQYYSQSADPCQNPSVAKLNQAIAIYSATTATIATTVTSKSLYICTLAATLSGTSPQVKLVTGTTTTTACDTGTVNITGQMAPTAGSSMFFGFGGTVWKVAAGKQICAIVSGTTPTFAGSLSYVAQ